MDAQSRKVLERIRQGNAAREADLKRAARAPAAAPEAAGLTHRVGTRVFDTISGEEGDVIHGARENLIVSTPK